MKTPDIDAAAIEEFVAGFREWINSAVKKGSVEVLRAVRTAAVDEIISRNGHDIENWVLPEQLRFLAAFIDLYDVGGVPWPAPDFETGKDLSETVVTDALREAANALEDISLVNVGGVLALEAPFSSPWDLITEDDGRRYRLTRIVR